MDPSVWKIDGDGGGILYALPAYKVLLGAWNAWIWWGFVYVMDGVVCWMGIVCSAGLYDGHRGTLRRWCKIMIAIEMINHGVVRGWSRG